jgi:hypothetical protein
MSSAKLMTSHNAEGTARNAVVVFMGLIVARIVSAADTKYLKNATMLAGDDVFTLVGNVPPGLPTPGKVRVFRQKSTLEDAIEFHAFAPLEARAGV